MSFNGVFGWSLVYYCIERESIATVYEDWDFLFRKEMRHHL